ncbi:MAG: hypothetical protein GKS02_09600 [Alphaproteobacteria bacterium]|nr:hypothetical protein [Alphaproteobacteria bacterium]
MTNTELSPEDHFAAHCSGVGGKDFSDDDDDYHQPPWLFRIAFAPTIENPHVSGLWVEREGEAFADQLNRLREELIASTRTIRKSHQLAVVKVGTINRLGQRHSRNLHVIYSPDQERRLPSHSEIRGIQQEDRILQQKIADNAEIHPIYPA